LRGQSEIPKIQRPPKPLPKDSAVRGEKSRRGPDLKTRKGVKESGATTRQGSPIIELFAAQPWLGMSGVIRGLDPLSSSSTLDRRASTK
jgi:hypothetical protein